MTPQFGASHADDSRDVIYDCNMFIVQATGESWVVFKQKEKLRLLVHYSLARLYSIEMLCTKEYIVSWQSVFHFGELCTKLT